jgi:hypothetical protein
VDLVNLQPTAVYIGLAINGLCAGLGGAIGWAIVEIYIKPKIKKIHKIMPKVKLVPRNIETVIKKRK